MIGMLYPLSGPTASAGLDEKHVYELFADMVNGKEPMLPGAFYQQLKGLPGFPGGARLRLIFVDHQGKPDIGQAEAERLITQEKVHVLVGSWQSSVTATTSQVAERFGIPHFNSESSSPGLTRRGFKWFFRSSPHDEHFTQAMFDFLADFQKKRGVKLETVAISNEDTLFGTDSAKVQRALAQKSGYRIVADFAYRANSTSLTAEVQKLKAANPDVWFPTSYQSDAILFTRTSKELDWNPKMILAQNSGHIDPKFIEATGKDSEGYLSRSPFAQDLVEKTPVAKALNPGYKARSGKDLYDLPGPRVHGHRDAGGRPQPRRLDRAGGDPRRPRQDRHQGRRPPGALDRRQVRRDGPERRRAGDHRPAPGRQVLDGLAVRGGGARRPLSHPEVVRPEVGRMPDPRG